MQRIVVALYGEQGAGKSEIAKILTSHPDFVYIPGPNWRRIRFAEPLKRMLAELLRCQGCPEDEIHRYIDGDWKEKPCPYLNGATARRGMRTLGDEWRDMISEHLYSYAWARSVNTSNAELVVADDIRYDHELEEVVNFPYCLCLVERPGHQPADINHRSEQEWRNWIPDVVVVNDRSIEDLVSKVKEAMPLWRSWADRRR